MFKRGLRQDGGPRPILDKCIHGGRKIDITRCGHLTNFVWTFIITSSVYTALLALLLLDKHTHYYYYYYC